MQLADYAAVLGVWLLAITSPGPDVVLVLRESVRNGRPGALAAALGIATGVVVWITLAMTGAHLLLEADPNVLGVLQLVGGGYLLFLGYGALRSAYDARGAADPELAAEPARAAEHRSAITASFRRGALTNLSNPKALVFFGTVFSVLVPESTTSAERVFLSILLISVACLWFGSLAWLSSSARVGAYLARNGATFDAVAGVAFVILGGLAVATGISTLSS